VCVERGVEPVPFFADVPEELREFARTTVP
jgi:hypothetical protein